MQLDSAVNGKTIAVCGRKFTANTWEPSQDPVLGPKIALDTETELIVDQTFPPLVLLQVTAGNRVDLVHWEDAPGYMYKLMRYNPDSTYFMLNAAYDMGVLNIMEFYDLVDSRQVVNLQDRYKLWEISERGFVRKPDSMANMAKQVLGEVIPKDDDIRLNFRRKDDPSHDQLYYGAKDAAITWMLADKIPAMPTEADSQIMGSIVLDAISRKGMLVDRELFDSVRKDFVVEYEKELDYLEMHGYNPLLGKPSTEVMRHAFEDLGVEEIPDKLTGPALEYMIYRFWLCASLPLEEFKKRVRMVVTEIDHEECCFFSNREYVDWYVEQIQGDFEGKLKRDRVAAARDSLTQESMSTIIEIGSRQRINPFKGKNRKRLNELVRGILDTSFEYDPGVSEPMRVGGLGLHEMAVDEKLCMWPMASVLRELFRAKAGKIPSIPEFDVDEFAKYIQEKATWYGGYSTEWVDCMKPTAFMQAKFAGIERTNPGVKFGRTDGGKTGKKQIKVTSKDKWIFKKFGIKDELVETFISYKHNEKIISTYLNPKHIHADGRVHTRFENYVRTGRTSSSKPNIQNVPGKGGIRDTYLPPPMYLYASIDYSQLELCSLAQHCYKVYGHSRMLELINAKIDLHSWFAGKTMGLITEENDYDGTPESRERLIPIIQDIKDNHVTQRSNAKAANFGFPGGMSAETFLNTQRGYGNIEITLDECEDLRDNWFKCFPEMAEHMQPLADVVTEYDRKRLDNPNLRLYQAKNIMGVLRRKCSFNSSCNFPFQSLAALGAKRALWAVWRSRYGKYMVNFIHDEILFELPVETAADDVFAIQKIMEEAMVEVIPDVRIEAEGCLMLRWNKKAEPVFDDFGNLNVWRPDAA